MKEELVSQHKTRSYFRNEVQGVVVATQGPFTE